MMFSDQRCVKCGKKVLWDSSPNPQCMPSCAELDAESAEAESQEIEQLRAEIQRMKPVVDAARKIRKGELLTGEILRGIESAVEDYDNPQPSSAADRTEIRSLSDYHENGYCEACGCLLLVEIEHRCPRQPSVAEGGETRDA